MEYILDSLPEEERPHIASQRKNGPKSHRSSLLPLRWSNPDAIVTELEDVLQLGVGLAGWGLAPYLWPLNFDCFLQSVSQQLMRFGRVSFRFKMNRNPSGRSVFVAS